MKPDRPGATGALALALAGMLAGACTVGPRYEAPATPAQERFTSADRFDDTAPPAAWWRIFGDQVLVALIERATGGDNFDLQGAAARVRQARAELGVADAATEPQVDLAAQATRDRYSRNSELFANVPFAQPRVLFNDERAAFDASWEIDLFGRARRASEAASARLEVAQANLRDVRVSVAGEVARTYIELTLDERELALGEADLAALRERARLVGLLFDAGRAGAEELRQAQAAARGQDAALAAQRAELAAARNALGVLVGMTPAQAQELIAAGRPVPRIDAQQAAVGLPSDLLRRRPDLRRAERELAAATADIGVATADLYPRFQLVGDFGADTIHPGEFTRQASRSWSLGPQLYLPLLGRERLQQNVQARVAARDEVLATYRQSVLAALAEVESAMARFDRARERRGALEQAWRDLEASAALRRDQQAAGRTNSVDVLDAEHAARLAQEQAVEAGASQAIQLVALYKALGGGWDD
jgi:NodT family efflux transporter outer membrane factor (OMF) lipoprotein